MRPVVRCWADSPGYEHMAYGCRRKSTWKNALHQAKNTIVLVDFLKTKL